MTNETFKKGVDVQTAESNTVEASHSIDDYMSMSDSAQDACDLLKGLANETRMMILCMLAEGEKTVSQLEGLLELRQPAISQQLARLRGDRLVKARRDGKAIYYSLASNEARRIIDVLYQIYCADSIRSE